MILHFISIIWSVCIQLACSRIHTDRQNTHLQTQIRFKNSPNLPVYRQWSNTFIFIISLHLFSSRHSIVLCFYPEGRHDLFENWRSSGLVGSLMSGTLLFISSSLKIGRSSKESLGVKACRYKNRKIRD